MSTICSLHDRYCVLKNASQDVEAKIKTEEEHAEGKPSSETLNKAKVKVRDALA
jgi:hypothetical protein